jgi:hypothetical protein
VAVGRLEQDTDTDTEVVPSVCVAPEQSDVAAICNALTTSQACQSHDAMCNWEHIGCVGTSNPCDSFAEQDACNSQISCRWGVE